MTAGMWTDGTRTRVRVPALPTRVRTPARRGERVRAWTSNRAALLPPVAIAACFLATLCMGFLHVASTGVDPMRQPVSSYVHVGGGWLFTSGIVAMAAACFAMAATPLAVRLGDLLRGVFVIAGTSFLTAAVFPTNAGITASGYSAEIHRYAAGIGMGALPVAGLLLALGLSAANRRRGVARRLMPLVIACAALLAATIAGTFLPDFMHGGDWRGVPQRLLLFTEITLVLTAAFLARARTRVSRS